jgi:hypothetical protein
MKVDLQIDELGLTGFDGDSRKIAAAVETHLAQLIGERGIPRKTALPGDLSIAVEPGASPHNIGQQIARAIHRSIGGRV